jgi:hypothetical protein
MSNKHLNNAKKNKNDEFFTQLPDIENELRHYQNHFKNKIVFCNCDDPTFSNFWKYFHLNFQKLKLKKLLSTHYSKEGSSYKMEYSGGNDSDRDIGIKTPLIENGDFRSQECIELLKKSDIVVTNPPFSLFREYVAQLIKYNKKFIIIGSLNALTCKGIFTLFKNNSFWFGYNSNKTFKFSVPDYYKAPKSTEVDEYNRKIIKMSAICWFTNCSITKQLEKIQLTEIYTPEKYPKYDNYDAINVDKVKEIPKDYDGVMGVPISFFTKYSPAQFEIIKFRKGDDNKDLRLSGTHPYCRILIRKIV